MLRNKRRMYALIILILYLMHKSNLNRILFPKYITTESRFYQLVSRKWNHFIECWHQYTWKNTKPKWVSREKDGKWANYIHRICIHFVLFSNRLQYQFSIGSINSISRLVIHIKFYVEMNNQVLNCKFRQRESTLNEMNIPRM